MALKELQPQQRQTQIRLGMIITLYDKEKHKYSYTVTENYIVEPNETWVLDDFGDNRITLITCTDDGTQRQIVIGKLKPE